MINRIAENLYSSVLFEDFEQQISTGNLFLSGISGSLTAFLVNFVYEKSHRKIIFVSPGIEELQKLKDDLDVISSCENISVLSKNSAVENEEYTKSLTFLADHEDFIVLISAEEFGRKILSKERFRDSLIDLKKNDEYLFEELLQKLQEYNYEKKDFVDEVGDYSVRGGIIDIFPENYDSPVRLEFFGETVDSIREFDISTQRSIRELESIKIGINLTSKEDSDSGNTHTDIPVSDMGKLTGYISKDTFIFLDEPEIIRENYTDFDILNELSAYKHISISRLPFTDESNGNNFNFSSFPQSDFHSNLALLYNNLREHSCEGFDLFILCSDENQVNRIKNLLSDFEDESFLKEMEKKEVSIESPEKGIIEKIIFVPESIHNGFVFRGGKILVYTEHQIFGRYFRQFKKRKRKFRGLTFEEFKELRPGDYVVHRDFGIGRFSGLKKINVGSSIQEVVKLSYEQGDTLFLNLNYVNLIKKFSASEGVTPKLTRLGGGEWDKIKERAKKKVKDIARDLIILYAKRKSEKGFAFSTDTHWQRELEASFIYEDTPDQYRATDEVKQDMMSENPMDRLICGDVGFGKTEVAVRAAFKAVLDNKQVAVLVPTTILAVQHYNTFRDRLSPFAVDVEDISRHKNKNEQIEILKRTSEGKINILIGTHRILSKDIKFKDLGLLIIDEEQRFGVKAKEKLRAIKPNVDTLTLTATPIPRTLNFSLLGARDLSVINTPPKNRKSIITEIIKLDWKLISGIIKREIQRNGQVYFVNDKIAALYKLADKLYELMPLLKIAVAHGQMDGKELEKIIVNFIEKKYDVLLCTKIIESGLDIPNVNTIIINNANMYGLSELYQLRGRVGRSDQQAFAYFISPPAAKLTKTAIRRLQAIEEYTDLGSGFNLSMRDMEIRGVGNLLGKQQSGFISQIGFETFIDIIDESVAELKENEFSELFKDEDSLKKISDSVKKKTEIIGTIIESDLNALIPKDFVENDTERLNLYKRLYEISDNENLIKFREELRDRFGVFADEVECLLRTIELKIISSNIGIEKVSIHEKEAQIYFPQDKSHKIFESAFFTFIIEKISTSKGNKFAFVNNDDRLIVQVILNATDDASRLTELFDILNT